MVSGTTLSSALDNSLKSTTTRSAGTAEFAGQLMDAIESYLKDHDPGSKLEVAIRQGETDGEIVLTMQEIGGETAAPDESPVEPGSYSMMYSGTVPYKPTAAVDATPKPPADVYDAYWATQPKEVQVLRTIDDETVRTAKAFELANAGYPIDTQIMVWRWDPLMTMRARESAGYTWVPSANQPGVQLPPGFSMAGMQEYDPFNPPAGAVKVSTEWAKGLEHTSIWSAALTQEG